MIPRHRQLLDHPRKHGGTCGEALASRLGVTAQTTRRDIRELGDAGLLARYHRGVGIIGISGIEADDTLLDHDDREVRVTQTSIEQSREV